MENALAKEGMAIAHAKEQEAMAMSKAKDQAKAEAAQLHMDMVKEADAKKMAKDAAEANMSMKEQAAEEQESVEHAKGINLLGIMAQQSTVMCSNS